MGAFPTFPGWENYVVGYLCWFFIFVAVRLTVFLPEQRPKLKLLAMTILLLCLSINVENGSMANPGQIACKIDLNNKLIQSKCSTNISWKNSEPSMVERNASANEPVITKTIPNTGKRFNGQIKIQLEQIKINEFNSQAKPILIYHSEHGQLERISGHTSGKFLRQLLYQDLSSLRKPMTWPQSFSPLAKLLSAQLLMV